MNLINFEMDGTYQELETIINSLITNLDKWTNKELCVNIDKVLETMEDHARNKKKDDLRQIIFDLSKGGLCKRGFI